MRCITDQCRVLVALGLFIALQGCEKPTTPATSGAADMEESAGELELEAGEVEGASDAGMPFEDAELFFELNSTDNDLGLQLFVDNEGWRRLRVLDPRRHDVLLISAQGRLGRLGITELRFESEEPEPQEVLELFPPGEYRFRGRTVEGEQLASTATLSHDLLPAPTFTPSGGEQVERERAVVEWDAPGAEKVEIIIENDELEHVLDVTLSNTGRRLRIPPQFLTPGQEYKIEVLSIAENGNRTITESTFEVAE
jgi:hypothetical protein